MTDEVIETNEFVEDPNEVVRFVCIDGLIRKATAEELASILETEERGARDKYIADVGFARKLRDKYLADSDWVELPSASQRLTVEKLAEWSIYRQALRDIPAQEGFPNEIVWPTQPT